MPDREIRVHGGVVILIALFFIVAGVLFAGIGIGIRRSGERFARTARGATATVTDVVSRGAGPRSDRGLIWVPVVRFQTAGGRTVEEEIDAGTNVRQHEPGQPLEVLYDPSNPSDVRVPGSAASTIIPAVFVFIGVTFAVLGIAVAAVMIAV